MKQLINDNMTAVEMRKRIHELRQKAEKLARRRFLLQWEVDRNAWWEGDLSLKRELIKVATAGIQRRLSEALRLEARLPEHNMPETRALDWWQRLQRLAEESEREVEVQTQRKAVPSKPEPSRVRKRLWFRATTRDSVTRTITQRYYQVTCEAKMQDLCKSWKQGTELVGYEPITEPEYLAGKEAWQAARRS
jgi:hypothetical protein